MNFLDKYFEGWLGSHYLLRAANALYETVSELAPEVEYDLMRLDKYLCMYWS